jgi:iron complex outermembrane receptor protein/hemoglobin/transferrin/lactoferrin receptor protein
VLDVDQGFRAPNLDDLTSRQQTGPGFQFENPDLDPERTTTFELGAQIDVEWISFDAWTFLTLLDAGIVRAVREAEDCPDETPACPAARNQLQLTNADGTAIVWGAEGGTTLYLPEGVTGRATVSWAWGEGPNPGARPSDPAFGQERVPLSRIPPLNGTLEARWRDVVSGLYAAAALRWALAQTRLAPQDRSDARIPFGGTPGYTVVDLRAGVRRGGDFRVSLVIENLFDAAWRAHGSSINGPGRGFIVEAMVGF